VVGEGITEGGDGVRVGGTGVLVQAGGNSPTLEPDNSSSAGFEGTQEEARMMRRTKVSIFIINYDVVSRAAYGFEMSGRLSTSIIHQVLHKLGRISGPLH
jgi:hypothetical protein